MKEPVLFLASAIVGVAANALGSFRRRGPERMLIVKLDHVGDLVLASAAIQALRDAHPEAVIDALVAPGSAFVLAGSSAVNRVLTYESPYFRRGPRDEHAPRLDEVVRDRYTTIVELRGDWDTLRLPFRCSARRRVDRGTVRLQNWLARRFDAGGSPLHEVETNLRVVRPLLSPEVRDRVQDATPERAPIEVARTTDADRTLARTLESAGVDPREPIACIHPGASWRPRAWDPARFAAVAAWIRDHYHAQVVFVGSDEERDIEASVRASIQGGRTFWLTGAISWDELHALLARSMLFVGNDSGPAHLAAAAGTPSVVLFGPQDPRRFGPWSARTVVLHHRAPCWPCAQTRCVRPEAPCVNDISTSEVQAAVARLLDVPARAAGLRSLGGEPPS